MVKLNYRIQMKHDKNHIITLIQETKIKSRLNHLVQRIAHDFNGKELIIIGILTGSFIFLADLIRLLHNFKLSLLIDFIQVSSYGSRIKSSGQVTIIKDININIKGKTVLIVDDILDTGRTLNMVIKHLLKEKPRLLRTCVFLDKPSRREIEIEADYTAFQIQDHFVIGYGLDLNNQYRELPFIAYISDN